MKLEMGSARNTPFTPRPNRWGRSSVRGVTMITLRNREKNTACLERPSATCGAFAGHLQAHHEEAEEVDVHAGTAASRRASSPVNSPMKNRGNRNSSSHTAVV